MDGSGHQALPCSTALTCVRREQGAAIVTDCDISSIEVCFVLSLASEALWVQLEPIVAKPGVLSEQECGPAWPSFRGH